MKDLVLTIVGYNLPENKEDMKEFLNNVIQSGRKRAVKEVRSVRVLDLSARNYRLVIDPVITAIQYTTVIIGDPVVGIFFRWDWEDIDEEEKDEIISHFESEPNILGVIDSGHVNVWQWLVRNGLIEKKPEPDTPEEPEVPTEPDTPEEPTEPDVPVTPPTTTETSLSPMLIIGVIVILFLMIGR